MLFALLSFGPVQAATWTVHPDGSGDAPTIQAAVNVAMSGDTVLLGPGTFTGAGNREILVVGKDLSVLSLSGPAATVLDCESAGRAVLVALGPTVTFSGITFRNGDVGATNGGAIYSNGADLTFTDCWFEDNRGGGTVYSGGGAIFSTEGTLTVANCRFTRNVSDTPNGVGGGISVTFGSLFVIDSDFVENSAGAGPSGSGGAVITWEAQTTTVHGCSFVGNSATVAGGLLILASVQTVTDCEFTGNSGGALFALGLGPVLIEDCTFEGNSGDAAAAITSGGSVAGCEFIGNSGGAVYIFGSEVSFSRCTFASNTAAAGGGVYVDGLGASFTRCTFVANAADVGDHLYVKAGGQVSLSRSILAFGMGRGVLCEGSGTPVTATCCDVYGNAEGDWVDCLGDQGGVDGNFSADPEFCDATEGNYTLSSSSPCAPSGSMGCFTVGAHPVACGPTSVEAASWAKVKALYRE